MRGESIVNVNENLSAWQEVVPRRLARSNRLSSQASPAMSGRKSPRILHLPDVNSPMSFAVMTSSTSPVPSENSDSSDPTYVEPTLPLPKQLSLTEPASIAERILSSEGRMSSAQQAYVASAARLARMMSPAVTKPASRSSETKTKGLCRWRRWELLS